MRSGEEAGSSPAADRQLGEGLECAAFRDAGPLGRVLGVSIDELVTGVAPAGKRLAPGDREAVTQHLEALCGLLM
ncbi:MAG TPA: hypothetical protein VKK31_09010 [Thermoanaerobaculia bacterium]|nr:hypothetical protein [Thermoanaerobaculia bacterium]